MSNGKLANSRVIVVSWPAPFSTWPTRRIRSPMGIGSVSTMRINGFSTVSTRATRTSPCKSGFAFEISSENVVSDTRAPFASNTI